MSEFVPLSVRDGGGWKKLCWWVLGRREALALWFAPWLRPSPQRLAEAAFFEEFRAGFRYGVETPGLERLAAEALDLPDDASPEWRPGA